jgi:hypothetical protein
LGAITAGLSQMMGRNRLEVSNPLDPFTGESILRVCDVASTCRPDAPV